MNITPINSYNSYNYSNNKINYKNSTTFCALTSKAVSESGLRHAEYGLRILANKITDLFEGKTVKLLTKNISEISGWNFGSRNHIRLFPRLIPGLSPGSGRRNGE